MRPDWLDDILAVAETGSFSEAAARRGLTQSAFSRRIQHIEEQVGVQLFDRARKPVQLRPHVVEQRERMEELSRSLRQLVHNLRHGERASGNRIVIASQHALTTTLTPSLLGTLQNENPALHVRLRSGNLDECLAQLLARQADIAIIYGLPGMELPVRQDFVEMANIGSDRLVPVVATGHRAQLMRHIENGELPHVGYPSGVFLGRVMEREILPRLRGHVLPTAVAETALTLAAIELASVGFATAWVPLSLARNALDEGRLIDVSDVLAAVEMRVTALRLPAGGAGAVEQAVWERLCSIGRRDEHRGPGPGARPAEG